MNNESYNGWSNWDTWNANLHLTTNDEIVYYDFLRCKTSEEVRVLFLETFNNEANCFDGIDYGCVNWHEINQSKMQGME
jgi:hypothetical protein